MFLRFSRHFPFYLAVAGGVLTLPMVMWIEPPLAIEAAANVFFLIYLVLSAAKAPHLTAAFLKAHASSADEPVLVIFGVTFGAVVVAVGSLFVLINAPAQPGTMQLGLSLSSVALGWLTIHTMAALHYAHSYWAPHGAAGSRGLSFPGDDEPCGYDFLYFAFVVGMTAQTSDVAITSTAMRRMNMLHAVVSFFFNTVLVAAAVNLAVSLGA